MDVVITVYEAIEDVDRCLEALRQHADGVDLRVIVVDDASSNATRCRLQEHAATWPLMTLVTHQVNLGYTRSANEGLQRTTADWVVLLNSDTVVTAGWLPRLLRCATSNDEIGIVGPLSNAATWQSVPHMRGSDGSFMTNLLPRGMEVDDFATVVAAASVRAYPRVPILNGFCMLIRRRVLERVGWMDAVAFPRGYGEENDYCLRAAGAGFLLAIADDCFVFHAKSKSFGHSSRVELSRRGNVALIRKHGRERVEAARMQLENHEELAMVRRRVQQALMSRDGRGDLLPLRVLFLLPVFGISGGASSVVLEAAEIARLGAFVRVAVGREQLANIGDAYREVEGIRSLLVPTDSHELLDMGKDFDVVVATMYHTAEWAYRMVAGSPTTVAAYYVQDYEPMFFPEGSVEAAAARASYERLGGGVLFAKSQWLIQTLKERHGLVAAKVEPGLDGSLFHADGRRESSKVRLIAMVRPQTPRRAAARTMRVLAGLVGKLGDAVEVHVFGCATTDPSFLALDRQFAFEAHGLLRRTEVASLLRRGDVFVDLSDYQAFGRASLEAMACGCAVVAPRSGGSVEFAIDGVNAVVVDTADETACVERLTQLVLHRENLARLQRRALETASSYSLERAALSELRVLSEACRSLKASDTEPRLRLVLSDQGLSRGPAWLRCLWSGSWHLPSVHRRWRVREAAGWPIPGSGDVSVILCSPRYCDWPTLAAWLERWQEAGGRAIAQLEPSFREGGLDERTIQGVRWLADAFDALVVASEADARELRAHGIAAFVVPLVAEPIRWRLGPSGRRTVAKERGPRPFRVGIVGDGRRGVNVREIGAAWASLAAEHGGAIRLESIEESSLGKRLPQPRGLGADSWVAWAQKHARWDLALVPSGGLSPASMRARLLISSALASTVMVADSGHASVSDLKARTVADTADGWGACIRDSMESWRADGLDAGEPLARLDALWEEAESQGVASLVLKGAVTSRPKHHQPLPRLLQTRFMGLFRGKLRYEVISHELPFPKPRSHLLRKFAKLRRDPYSFFSDSKWPAARALRGLFR